MRFVNGSPRRPAESRQVALLWEEAAEDADESRDRKRAGASDASDIATVKPPERCRRCATTAPACREHPARRSLSARNRGGKGYALREVPTG